MNSQVKCFLLIMLILYISIMSCNLPFTQPALVPTLTPTKTPRSVETPTLTSVPTLTVVPVANATQLIQVNETPASEPINSSNSIVQPTRNSTTSITSNDWYLQQILTLDAPTGDGFGRVTAISGDRILIGTGQESGKRPLIGDEQPEAIYLFELDQKQHNNWTLTKTWPGDYADIAFQGDSLVISQSQKGVLLFEQTQQEWKKFAELTTPDYGRIGGIVAIDGDTVVVGNPHKGDHSPYGRVFIFRRNQGGINVWGLVTTLSPPSTAPYDFGEYVTVSGDVVAVGARSTIHVFEKDYGGINNWGQVAEWSGIDPPDQVIASDGKTIVVGIPSSDNHTGQVVIFERDQDEEDQWERVIIHSKDELHPRFGLSVAIKGDKLVVGAQDAAYIFERANHRSWQQVMKLPAPDARAQGGGFGGAVAIEENIVIVGAIGAEYYSGSAYIFVRGRAHAPLLSEKPPRPDLVVIGVSDHVLKSGRFCVLDLFDPNEYGTAVRIKNIGEGRAEPFEVTIGDWSQMVASGLQPGQDVTLMFPYGGKVIEIDPTSQIEETNEDNNVVSGWPVSIPTPPPTCIPTASPTLTPTVTPEP